MLDRQAGELGADFQEQGFAVVAFDAVDLDLDQFVGLQGQVNFLQHGRGEAMLADTGDGFQMVGSGAQGAALI